MFGRRDVSLVDEETNPLGLDRDDPAGKDDITTINQLHIPVGKPVLINLTSKDVIHSFSLNELRIKQDAIPGISIPISFEAKMTSPIDSTTGLSKWNIACAQLCGLGHYKMRGYLYVHTMEDFKKWLEEQAALLEGEEDVW